MTLLRLHHDHFGNFGNAVAGLNTDLRQNRAQLLKEWRSSDRF
ncbi:MAG: hypothetical protein ACR2LR_21425 [Hassallia sp.]